MIPKGAEGVEQIRHAAMAVLIDGAENAYAATMVHYLCQLLDVVAVDFDRMVENLVYEHRELAAIFDIAGGHVLEDGLKARLSAASAMESQSLRVSDLLVRSDAGLKVLIELQEFVETARDDGAAQINELDDLIWQFLEGYVERRKYKS
jgi:hypothetical protein